MSYGAIVNLPNGLQINENSVPFALADILELTSSNTSGSKTYTGFEGRTVIIYKVIKSVDFLNGALVISIPYYHTVTITDNGVSGVAPKINWSVSATGNYLADSVLYVVMI
jgi:hypothetical protein